jgi:hypothetical protein
MGGLFSSPKMPAPPVVKPPAVMPVPDTESDLQRKKRDIAKKLSTAGRASTIKGNDTLGGA